MNTAKAWHEHREYLASISRMQAPGHTTPLVTRGAAQDVLGTQQVHSGRGGEGSLSVSGVSCSEPSFAIRVFAPGSKPSSAVPKLGHLGQVTSLSEVQLPHLLETINAQEALNVWGTGEAHTAKLQRGSQRLLKHPRV